MNSVIFICLGLLCVVHFGESATAIAPDTRHPDHPGKCVTEYEGKTIIMNPGETMTERKSCTRISCSSSYAMDFASCGTVGGPAHCHLSKIDETKDYPDCCPKVVCPSRKKKL